MDKDADKYAFLDRFSTEQLEELLRADLESLKNNNSDLVLHILEVIEQREKEHETGRLPEVAEAWAEFQEYYNTPEGQGRSLYPYAQPDKERTKGAPMVSADSASAAKPFHAHWALRYGLAAIIAIIVLLGGMLVVHAAGIDVFGALGRWTADTFHFETGNLNADASMELDTAEDKYVSQMKSILQSHGMPMEFIPTWFPEGYKASSPEYLSNSFSNTVLFPFSSEDGGYFDIVVTCYNSESYLEKHTFEKDDAPVAQYTSEGKIFYIFSNIGKVTATWSDGVFVETISGDLTTDEVKTIIDSIGG